MFQKILGAALIGSLAVLSPTTVLAEEPRLIPQLCGIIQENEELKTRVDKLEKALDIIRAKRAAAPTTASVAVTQTTVDSKGAPATLKKEEKKEHFLKTKNQVEFYGYLKLDTIHDSARTDIGNYARWVQSRSTHPADSQYSMTMNQTRFGLNFKGPDDPNFKTTAKIELELYGAGGTESKPNVGMRHAYYMMDWAEDDVNLLLGQTTDLAHPLFPNTLNYTVSRWAGNIGFRHPQLRLSKGVKVTNTAKLLFQGAVVRPIGETGPFVNGDTGFDSGQPMFQGRVALQFPTYLDKKSAEIGISGHSGREEYDFNAKRDNNNTKTRSLGIDMMIPVSEKFGFKGEFWQGKNLDQLYGGIGQGTIVTSASGTQTFRYINPAAWTGNFTGISAIESKGGWLELNFGPFAKKWRFNVGAGIDNPEDEIMPDASRIKNENRWLNAMYDLNDYTQFGLEFAKWDTQYKNRLSGSDNRLQFSCIYKF